MTGRDQNPSKCRSSRAQDRSRFAYLIPRPPARKCKACPTLLRSGNASEYCSLHAHLTVVDLVDKINKSSRMKPQPRD